MPAATGLDADGGSCAQHYQPLGSREPVGFCIFRVLRGLQDFMVLGLGRRVSGLGQ